MIGLLYKLNNLRTVASFMNYAILASITFISTQIHERRTTLSYCIGNEWNGYFCKLINKDTYTDKMKTKWKLFELGILKWLRIKY